MFKFGEPCVQYSQSIVAPSHEPPIAIRTDRAFRELRARRTGSETALAALETASNAFEYRLLGYLEPAGQIQGGPQSRQDRHNTFRLRPRARKSVAHKAVTDL